MWKSGTQFIAQYRVLSSFILRPSIKFLLNIEQVGETYGKKMMAGYIRSKGQVLNQRINPTDHQRRRADTVRVRNPIPYNAAYYGHKLHCDQNEKLSRYGCTLFAFKFPLCMDAVPK